MNKNILLFIISLIAVFSIITLIVVFISGSGTIWGEERVEAITSKETAIKIGRALLEEFFSDIGSETILEAEEKKGVWRVYSVLPKEFQGIGFGGELYVMFRRNNGQVLKVGVND